MLRTKSLRNSNGSWKSHLGYYSNPIKKHWATYLVVRISRWLIHTLQIIYLKCNWSWLLLILMTLWDYSAIHQYPHVIIWSIWPPLSNLLSKIVEITPNKFEIANKKQLFMCVCCHIFPEFHLQSKAITLSVLMKEHDSQAYIQLCLHIINVNFASNKTEFYHNTFFFVLEFCLTALFLKIHSWNTWILITRVLLRLYFYLGKMKRGKIICTISIFVELVLIQSTPM